MGFFRSIKKTANKTGRGIRKAANKTGKGFEKTAHRVGRGIETAARKTGKGVGKATRHTGRHMSKAAHQTGRGLEKAAHQTGRGIERTARKTTKGVTRAAHQTGRGIEKVSRETAKGMGRAIRETGKGLDQIARKTGRILEPMKGGPQNLAWALGIGRKGKIFPRLNTSRHPDGTHVFVYRGAYEHHGIYVGDRTVVEYSNKHGVRTVSLSKFRRGTTIYVQRYSNKQRAFSHTQIVERALRRVNEKNYNVPFSNCEHLARWCVTGKSSSPQVTSVAVDLLGITYSVRLGLRTAASELRW